MTEGFRKNIAGFGHQVGPLASVKSQQLDIEMGNWTCRLIDRTPGISGYDINHIEDDSDSVESFSRNVQG